VAHRDSLYSCNSPLLRSKCFIECRLGATIIRETGDYLCVFDSFGGVPAAVADCCENVDIKELRKLFPKHKETYLTAVSLHNAHLGPRAVRSRSITASRIEDTIPTFDDHSFICRTAKGKSTSNGQSSRRYVGFGSGKITDSSLGRVTFTEYLSWLDNITRVLASASTSITSFARFAKHSGPPADATPEHLLLDVRQIEGEFLSGANAASGAGQQLSLEDACCEVSSGAFSVMANSKSYSGTIQFNTPREVPPIIYQQRLDITDQAWQYSGHVNTLDFSLRVRPPFRFRPLPERSPCPACVVGFSSIPPRSASITASTAA
jgi:hypothetical protein